MQQKLLNVELLLNIIILRKMKFTRVLKLLSIVLSLSNVILLGSKPRKNIITSDSNSNSIASANKTLISTGSDFSKVERNHDFSQFKDLVSLVIESNQITVKSSDCIGLKTPVFFGKGMLNMLEALKNSNANAFESLRLKFNAKNTTTDQTIVFENKENLQFFLFYIVYPPMAGGPNFYQFKYSKNENSPFFKFIFKEQANIYQLFSIVSASFGRPDFFQKINCIELSQTQMANIEHR